MLRLLVRAVTVTENGRDCSLVARVVRVVRVSLLSLVSLVSLVRN